MNELAGLLKSAAESLPGSVHLSTANLDRTGLRALLRTSALAIVPSSDGEISTVYESGDLQDFSHQTGQFDLHKDGLYYPNPPHFVLLLCEEAGRGDSPTVVVDTRPVIEQIERRTDLEFLKGLEVVYRGRNGDEHPHPLVARHPLCDCRVLNLGARAYVRPRVEPDQPGDSPPLRAIASAMNEVFRLLDKAVVLRHYWKKGDVLLMDNHAFVHGREARSLDSQRRLLRVWLSLKDKSKE